MIREIINFTEQLIEDMPDISQHNLRPHPGLYVFIDISETGEWSNRELVKGKDYDYYDGKDTNLKLWTDCIRFQEATIYIEMNKVGAFDKKKKIHSCSPFATIYNFNFSSDDKKELGLEEEKNTTNVEKEQIKEKIRKARRKIVSERLNEYRTNANRIYKQAQESATKKIVHIDSYTTQVEAFYRYWDEILDTIEQLPEYKNLKDKNYLCVFLRTVPIAYQETLHDCYVKSNLLNGVRKDGRGTIGFLTSYNAKKIFLQHRTGAYIQGTSVCFSSDAALSLNKFEKMWKQKCLPNPLPIVVDKRETNKELVKIFTENNDPMPFRELLKSLFNKNIKLSNYYLLNLRSTMDGMVLDDFDFVPLFRYKYDSTHVIENVTEASTFSNGTFVKDCDERLYDIFDFERIVVKTIFNNSLVKIKDGRYKTYYFEEIKPEYVIGKEPMWQLIMSYRKVFYDYVYKSATNAITASMFEDMMYNSILTNIRQDEITSRCEYNNNIKEKINIWFSLYNLFNNDKTVNIMASNVTDLKAKMASVSKGDSNIETPEEFAFGAGQLASYLIDRSAASNKTYGMLETYLQKCTSGQLQDTLAQTMAIYKHEINVYKGRFELLASQVLTFDGKENMKPLLKYFLAGCFCPCVIYTPKEENNSNQ